VQATAHAVATPVVGNTGGVVFIVIDNPGTGYTSRPTVTVTGGTRNAGGTAASGTGTANANLGLGANIWFTPYTAITAAAAPVGNTTSVTATGLTSGTAYQFQVQAVPLSGASSAFVTTGAGVIKAQ
jgi:chitin-binding protein